MKAKPKLFAFLLFFAPSLLFGQAKFQSDFSDSKFQILGTSSLHDWESDVTEYVVTGNVNGEKIINLNVEVKSNSIESGKSAMDSKIYDALESKKFPTISFKANALSVQGQNKVSGTGTLTLVGKTKSFPITAQIQDWGKDSFKVLGELTFKMSEFDIDPPTAMFGTLKTGDEITIKYQIKLKNLQ